jgi:hypothetical protein
MIGKPCDETFDMMTNVPKRPAMRFMHMNEPLKIAVRSNGRMSF